MIAINIRHPFLKRVQLDVTWQVIYYGLTRGLIGTKEVIAFATDRVSKKAHSDDEFAVAISFETDNISDIVRRIAEAEEPCPPGAIETTWAKIVAAWISETCDRRDDPLSLIMEVYAAFGYPVELAPFVRYMPTSAPDLGSTELNESRMLAELARFANHIVAPIANEGPETLPWGNE